MKRSLEAVSSASASVPPAPEASSVPPDDLSDLPASWACVCLGISGSVAAVKAPELTLAFLRHGVSVDLVVTEAAHSLLLSSYRGEQPWARLEAIAAATAPHGGVDANDQGCGGNGGGSGATPAAAATASPPSLRIFRDADEWRTFSIVGQDPVMHIELAKRNQLLLIAPLCANTLAAAALGLCGNLLGSVLRAWYYDLDAAFATPLAERYGAHAVDKPVLVAPAMNTFMWHQRVTGSHLAALEARGVRVVPPVAKKLACGDTGVGAMAEVPQVVQAAVEALRKHTQAQEQAVREGRPPFVP